MKEKLKILWVICISLLFLLIIPTIVFSLPLIIIQILYLLICILGISIVVVSIKNKDDTLPEVYEVLKEKLIIRYREVIIVGILIVFSLLNIEKGKVVVFLTIFLVMWLFYSLYCIYNIRNKIHRIEKKDK